MKKEFLLLLIIFCLFQQVLFSIGASRTLRPGWNLVSIPLSAETDVSSYLSANLSGELKSIWTFEGQWESYKPGLGQQGFTTFKPNRGYWFLMDSQGGSLIYENSHYTRPLSIDRTGWVLASFNQTRSIEAATEVFQPSNIDTSHEVENIKKIWGFDLSWINLIPAEQNGVLKHFDPGFAYWFFIQSTNQSVVDEESVLTITPNNSSGDPQLVIGGATSLVPPSQSSPSPALMRAAPNRFSTQSSPSSTLLTKVACAHSEDEGESIGFARAFSIAGEQLNSEISAPVYCGFDSQGNLLPVSYELRFSSREKQYLRTNPILSENIVVSVELNSGQELKALIPTALRDVVAQNSSLSIQSDINESSSLSVALLGLEVARKLGVPSEQIQLGEADMDLQSFQPEILTAIEVGEIDIENFSQLALSATTSFSSPMHIIRNKIREINDPAFVFDPNRAYSKSEELSRILAGNSIDSQQSEFSNQLEKMKRIAASSSDLLSKRNQALRKGILKKNQQTMMLELAHQAFAMDSDNDLFLDVVDVVTDSLSIAAVTSGSEGIGLIAQSNFEDVVSTVEEHLEELGTNSNELSSLEVLSKAVSYPEEIAKEIAFHKTGARDLGRIFSRANSVLTRIREEGNQLLNGLDQTVSKIEESENLLDTLVRNAPDTDTVSEILSGAVESSSDSTYAAQRLFSRISTLKTQIESTGELRVDFANILKKGLGKARDLGSMVHALSKNAADSSDASEILALGASALTTMDLDRILTDEKLSKDFGLRNRVFVNAGNSKVIEYEGSSAVIILNAGRSFDPLNSTLSYQWFAIDSDTETLLPGLHSATITQTLTGLSGVERRKYKVVVTSEDSRHGSAEVDYVFRQHLPPVIVAPDVIHARLGKELGISAEGSFDPKTGEKDGLSYLWDFGGDPHVSIQSSEKASAYFTFHEPGVFDGVIKVSESETNYATKPIRVLAKGLEPPVADAGRSIVFHVDQILHSGGLKLENFSYSREGTPSSALSYLWEPVSYFASHTQTAREPTFLISEPGSYLVTLTITEGEMVSQDDLEIQVISSSRPVAIAGADRVIELGDSGMEIELDGTASYSYTTDEPQFTWSGPLPFLNDSKNSARAQVSLTPSAFPRRSVLNFGLEVRDAAGSSRDSLRLVILPKSRPPQIITELTPKKAQFSPGDIIKLDASSSFSGSTAPLSFRWTNLSGIPLESGEDSLDTSSVRIAIPEVNQPTLLRMVLEISDENGLSSRRRIVLPAVPSKLPPVALINVPRLLLRDRAEKENRQINAHLSYSRTGGSLTYQWGVDTSLIAVQSSSLSSSTLELQAVDQVSDGQTRITLTVTDQNGLSSSVSIPVRLEAIEQSTRPVELIGFFKKELSNTSFLETPYFDAESGLMTFEGNGSFQVFGVAFNPNEASDETLLSAAIFELENGGLGSLVQSLSVSGSSVLSARSEFGISGVLPSPGQYGLKISALSTTVPSLNNWISLPFEVLSTQPANLGASLKIAGIDSLSRGFQTVNQGSFHGRFNDELIRVYLESDFTGLRAGHPVEYEFDYHWLSGSGPDLVMNQFEDGKSQVMIPLSTESSTLRLDVLITDSLQLSESASASIILTLERSSQAYPVADYGDYPIFTLSEGQEFQVLTLDGSESLSPAGNPIHFEWTYLFSSNQFGAFGAPDVFGTSATASTSRIAQVRLPEGVHSFTLKVTDSSSSLSDSVVFAISVQSANTTGGGLNGAADEDNDGIAAWLDVDDSNPQAGLNRSNQFKFLTMASFGPTEELFQELTNSGGAAAWIDLQLGKDSAYTSPDDDWLTHLQRTIELANAIDADELAPEGIFNEFAAEWDIQYYQMSAWWENALGNNPSHPKAGSDQLRQRMAYALSQLIVVSPVENLTERRGEAIAHFYDLLAKHAFGNYQELLREISRSPAMGVYLTHVANQKASKLNSTRPDENFARELLQLFTLGLYALDSNGLPIPEGSGFRAVYTQDDIEELAKIMTGWNITQADKNTSVAAIFRRVTDRRGDFTKLMTFHPEYHEDEQDPIYDLDGDDLSDEDGRITLLGQQVELDAPDFILDGSDSNTNSGLDAAISVIFHHPNVPFHVAKHLIQHFVTSNPSQEFVKRAASVFADDGAGTRGNLGAVIKAVLLDPEAFGQETDRGGKIKEPLLAFTQMQRALNARPFGVDDPSGGWKDREGDFIADTYWYNTPESLLGYAPMRSPSVFNFFSPNYSAAYDLLASNELVTPELEIQTDQFFVTYMRLILHTIFSREKVAIETEKNNSAANITSYNFNSSMNFWSAANWMIDFTKPLNRMEEAMEGDTNMDFSTMNLTEVDSNGKTPRMRGAEALLDWYETDLLGKPMLPQMRLALMEYILKGRTYHSESDSQGTDDDWKRIFNAIKIVQETLEFIIMSPEFMVQN